MPLTDTDQTFLREVDARERVAIKAFTTGEGTVEMAAKAISDVPRLREIIDLLAGEQVHAEWRGWSRAAYTGTDEYGEPVYARRKFFRCSKCRKGTVVKHKFCPNCGATMDGERAGKEPDDG